jgi:uncharacterized protein with NRDE domain
MCTVTYIPKPDGSYILTSNRDEAPHRSPQNLEQVQKDALELIFPRDTAKGGTWIGVSNRRQVVCLLNGAFEKHRHQPPYRRSRGLMVLDFFTYPDARKFAGTYEFQGMEPFTFIVLDREEFWEIRWDGGSLHRKMLDPGNPHIWASATLYDSEAQEKRQNWFKEFLQEQPQPDAPAILDFHQNTGDGDPWNDLIMNRDNRVRTVSISQILAQEASIDFRYEDLLRKAVLQKELLL